MYCRKVSPVYWKLSITTNIGLRCRFIRAARSAMRPSASPYSGSVTSIRLPTSCIPVSRRALANVSPLPSSKLTYSPRPNLVSSLQSCITKRVLPLPLRPHTNHTPLLSIGPKASAQAPVSSSVRYFLSMIFCMVSARFMAAYLMSNTVLIKSTVNGSPVMSASRIAGTSTSCSSP